MPRNERQEGKERDIERGRETRRQREIETMYGKQWQACKWIFKERKYENKILGSIIKVTQIDHKDNFPR